MSTPQQQQAQILVVEDEIHLLEIFSRSLQRAGYSVAKARTLADARALLDAAHFDLLLCDIHLGSERATSLLRERAKALSQQRTQIIVMSAEARYRDECEQLGVDFYLEKPVIPDVLVTIANRLLASK
jgi:DNA-binding response OmpR family regulator